MTACWAVAQVHTIGVCGSRAGDWLKATPGDSERTGRGKVVVLRGKAATVPIKQLLAADKADLILIVFGDTMGAYDKPAFPKSWIWQHTTKLTKEIASTGTQCVWVGPNWGTDGGKFGKTYSRAKLVSSFLASNVVPCTSVDSLKFSQPGQWATLDGQHLTGSGYKQWGDAISKALVDIQTGK